ncbi:MAG: hypothetical protein AAGC55_23615, partial [Myxococcota bacterium]
QFFSGQRPRWQFFSGQRPRWQFFSGQRPRWQFSRGQRPRWHRARRFVGDRSARRRFLCGRCGLLRRRTVIPAAARRHREQSRERDCHDPSGRALRHYRGGGRVRESDRSANLSAEDFHWTSLARYSPPCALVYRPLDE